MDRSVNVLRCRRTGVFVLNPVGTFRGYGGYVGINPYRELSAAAGPAELGDLFVELLAASGPTGVLIADAPEFLKESADEETRRIRTAHRLDAARRSLATFAKRFASATVELRAGRRSWHIQEFAYDTRRRLLSGDGIAPVRVSHQAGSEALGAAVQQILVTMG